MTLYESCKGLCNNPECIKARQDLKNAWETILRMDRELKLINIALAEIEARQDPRTYQEITDAAKTRSL